MTIIAPNTRIITLLVVASDNTGFWLEDLSGNVLKRFVQTPNTTGTVVTVDHWILTNRRDLALPRTWAFDNDATERAIHR